MTLDQLISAYTAVHDGVAPDAATQARLNYFVQLSANQPSDAAAMSYIVNSADNSTALAALSYQFFTGKAPTKAGIDYLVNSPVNTSDLNDSYYAQFNIENRYINFAANLGVRGEGAASFATKYGALSFGDYVASIYQTIIGGAYATAAGIDPAKAIADIVARKDAILATATSAGMIPANATAAQIDIALKAATAGYLMGEAIKADVGVYASAANNFMVSMALGTATYGTDLTTTYAKPAGTSGDGGQAIAPNFAFPAPVVTPPADTGTSTAPPAPVAHAFTLTAGTDALTGEGLVDTFTGVIGVGATLNAADVLNGAAGDDTLTLTATAVGSAFTFDPTKITDIEHLRVTQGGATGGMTLDLGGIGFTDVTNTGSTQSVTFNNAAPTTGLAVASTFQTTTFTTPNAGLTGTSDTITLKLDTVAGGAGVTIKADVAAANQYETLNIVSNGVGTNAITLATDTTQTSLATINVSGAANLTLAFATGDKTLTNAMAINASTFTGNLNVTAGTAANAITGGSGNDVIQLGVQGANAAAGADAISTGTGSDTIRFVGVTQTAGNAADLTTFATINDFSLANDKLAFSASDTDFSSLALGVGTAFGLAKGNVLAALTAGDTMTVQDVAAGATVVGAGVSFIKLTTAVAFTTDIKGMFAAAIGVGQVTTLADGGNYLVSVYDTTHGAMIIGVANTRGGAGGILLLTSADFSANMTVVGVVSMTQPDYTAFGAGHLGTAF